MFKLHLNRQLNNIDIPSKELLVLSTDVCSYTEWGTEISAQQCMS